MPLKLKLSGGDSSKRTKSSQSNSTKSSSSNHSAASPDLRGKHAVPSSRHGRHHAPSPSRVEPVSADSKTPSKDSSSSSSTGDRRNNNNNGGSPKSASPVVRPAGSPRPGPAGTFPKGLRPKSVSEPPLPPDDTTHPPVATGKSKEAKPGRNRAFTVSRSGKFKEAKRRTSMLEIEDRFDKAAKGDTGDKS